ncbi:hypothetical protein Zmor_008269 [Zophobas morio]|uniref:Odorant receptor n=1 Tax=Zophobas morio TaxID=2755281 RepID=A0AA38IW55_9CUCU|nr:hypothetical protein Zmor_008269 [Zophobas morio]
MSRVKIQSGFINRNYRNDPYWLIRRIFIDFFRYKLIRFLVKLMLICSPVIIILETIILLEVFDAVFFIKYYMSYITGIFMWFTLYSIFQIKESVSTGVHDLRGWKIGSTGSTVEKLLRREIYYENLFLIVTVFLAVINGIAFTIPDENDKDFFLPFIVFERFFPIFERVLILGCRLNVVLITIIMTTPFNMIMYFCGHIRVQFTMFVVCLENLDYGYDNVDPLKSLYNDEYQKEVTRRLKFCIERHIRIYSVANRILRDLRHFIFIFSIIAVLYTIGILVYGATFPLSSPQRYLYVLSMVVCFIFIFLHMIWTGQATENVTSQMFEALKQTAWYCWNEKNKKIFLMFVLNGRKAFKLQFSQNVSVNYQLGVSILKSVFSAVTVLARLQNDYLLEGN